MTIHSHARCDFCERLLVPPPEDQEIGPDEIKDAGWLILTWSEETEDDTLDHTRDFCSLRCVAKWCVKEIGNGEESTPGIQSGSGEDR